MYPSGTQMIYSNFTPRKSRIKGVDAIVFFGLQHFILETLIKAFNTEFFNKPWAELDAEYKEEIDVNTDHIKALHELQYLPIIIKALPEGSLCPIGVPCFTVRNTHRKFGWLTNYLETLISTSIWQPITSATIAREYKKLLNKAALETTGTIEGNEWYAHDFSMRGMSSVETAITSGMGHLTSFTGSDCIPAIYQLKKSYGATGLIGASVPATEHSVMCMGEKESETQTFLTLLSKYPTGLLSVVSDTWNLWDVCTKILPAIKAEVLARDGKLVIRPDSGDPADILCGTNKAASLKDYSNEADTIDDLVGDMYIPDYVDEDDEDAEPYRFTFNGKTYDAWAEGQGTYVEYGIEETENKYEEVVLANTPAEKGVIELLWEVFGGTVNEQGFKVLDSHIGAIYGDSITLERGRDIMKRLADKGFAYSNVVLGIGSYTYQYNTRDTFGFAMKATYGEVERTIAPANAAHGAVITEGREIFKDPITDDGTKKSAKGLLRVDLKKGKYVLSDRQTWEQEAGGALETVFLDGKLVKTQTLSEIRARVIENTNI